MPHEAYKNLGVVSIAIAVLAGWWLVRMWPQGKKSSLSHHAGAQTRSLLLFRTVLVLDGLLFVLFMLRWFIPTTRLPAGFTILLLLEYGLQLTTAVIPDRGNASRMSRAHALVAFSMAVTMMLLVGWLALAVHVAAVPRLLAGITFLSMGVFWYLFLFVRSSRRHFLLYQSAYIGSAYACILAATYIR